MLRLHHDDRLICRLQPSVFRQGVYTPKFNYENDGFQKESPFPAADFQVSFETSGVFPSDDDLSEKNLFAHDTGCLRLGNSYNGLQLDYK